jgi:hypothetical protein
MTSLGAFLAVFHVMFGALVATGLTEVSADFADGDGMITVTRHHGCGHYADLRAVHVQGDALGHHRDVWLLQARRCTMIAGDGAAVAGLNAGDVFVVGHQLSRCWVDKNFAQMPRG